MAARAASKRPTPKPKASPPQPAKTQMTLVPSEWGKKSGNGPAKGKPKATPNGNIMAFFKKAEEQNNRIFLQERGANPFVVLDEEPEEVGWSDETKNGVIDMDDAERYNENGGSIKKRKVSEEVDLSACTPPPPDTEVEAKLDIPPAAPEQSLKPRKRAGPFMDDSDSEADEQVPKPRRGTIVQRDVIVEDAKPALSEEPPAADKTVLPIEYVPPLLKSETTSQFGGDDFDDFEGLEDDELLEGEEYDERRWMEEQRRLEMAESGFEGDPDDFDAVSMFPDETGDEIAIDGDQTTESPSCPICSAGLASLSEQEVSLHVNACLDGKPMPLPNMKVSERESTPTPANHKMFKRPPRPAKPGQENPFKLGETVAAPKSAFSKLMANHAEDAAWATAAAYPSHSQRL